MINLIIWNVKKLVDVLKERRKNEFDGNIVVSGSRGDGKSNLINKIFYKIKGFKPWKHQVYSREDVINLLKSQKYGLCFDDEAINTGYKRNFQLKGQQELIKVLTAYRDNYNIHASAIPNFFSLDKDLRDLYFLHLHVIRRGVAIVHTPILGRLYSQDKWDVKFNAQLEYKWSEIIQRDPTFSPPYHNLTTFRGILYFGDFTKKQEELYKKIKKEKREQSFLTESEKKKELSFIDKTYNLLIKGEFKTMKELEFWCKCNNEKFSNVRNRVNIILKDKGIDKTVKDCCVEDDNKKNEIKREINNLVPDV